MGRCGVLQKVLGKITHRRALKFIVTDIVIGSVILVIGIGIGIAIGNVLKTKMKKELIYSPDNIDDELQEEPDSDTTPNNYDMYLFNVTNAEGVLRGERPVVRECGPYSFKLYTMWLNATFSNKNKHVTLLTRSIYVFDKERGGPNPFTDRVTLLNLWYLAYIGATGSEANLLVLMTGGVLASINTQLTSEAFQMQVLLATAATMVDTVRTTVVSSAYGTSFYGIWANYTVDPPSFPSNMRVAAVTGAPSGLSYAEALRLWDCSSSVSFCNTNKGATLWATAASGDTAAASAIITATGISTAELSAVAAWFMNYVSNSATPYVLSTYGISQLADIGYVQFGYGTPLGGVSVSDLTGLAAPLEIAIWASRSMHTTFTLSVAKSKSILAGAYSLGTPSNLVMFSTLVQAGNFTTVASLWGGLTSTEATVVLSFALQSCLPNFAVPALQQVEAEGGGLFSTRTAGQWMFATNADGTPYADPLVSLLLGTNTAWGLVGNDTTVATALARNSTQTFNTGKKNLKDMWQTVAYNGVSNLTFWQQPVKVEGTDGTRFKPFLTSTGSLDKPKVYSNDLKRPMTMYYRKTIKRHGIKLYRYDVDRDGLKRDNDTYNQNIAGFFNMTAQPSTMGAPVFASAPHFLYVPDETWLNNITGMSDPDEDLHATYTAIEPLCGNTMEAKSRLQLNIYLDQSWTDVRLGTLHTGITPRSMIPVYWTDKWGGISEDDANDYKDKVLSVDDMAQVILLACVISGTVLLIVGLTLLALWLASRRSAAAAALSQSSVRNGLRFVILHNIILTRGEPVGNAGVEVLQKPQGNAGVVGYVLFPLDERLVVLNLHVGHLVEA
eukprot:TRINITY_DN267_c0_g1_i1.p1 TRINITY_DN267_c0_g1~~TRINITY_DN267_c0_g1_i1.p1  ORF type:complete len:839 (-),score=185.94 TRINITY_DN267_c0_g1_i1:1428-3944(-)